MVYVPTSLGCSTTDQRDFDAVSSAWGRMPLRGAPGRAEAAGHGIIPARSREAVLGSISGADVLGPGFCGAGVRAVEQLVIAGTAATSHL